jgi:uridylate kinase
MEGTSERARPVIVSLGGSLVVPDGIDALFIGRFRECIERRIARGDRFVIIVGGGKTARNYQGAAREVAELSDEDADWLGVHATRLNAHLLRTIFKPIAHPKLFSSVEDIMPFAEPVAVGAGWRPGWSTDYVAASIAEHLGAKRIVNLSNTDHVYSKDPKAYHDAEKLDRVSWDTYRTLIPHEWHPGLNTPFDPIASQKAEELGLEVAVINGRKLDQFERYLNNESFEGTTIY